MAIDPNETVKIEASPLKMLLLVFGCVAFLAICGFILYSSVKSNDGGSFAAFVAYIGIGFFGLMLVLILHRIFKMRGPIVEIGPQGILDRRLAPQTIPWSALMNITSFSYQHQRFVVLELFPEEEAKLTLSRTVRWTRGMNQALGADGLCMSAGELKISHAELLDLVIDYAEAWLSPTPTSFDD